MIQTRHLSKEFKVHRKEPGLKGSLKSLLRRKWETRHALQDVSLEVGEGEIVGLVGANGAGKTTLVKACAGIIHPSHGEVRVLGYNPAGRDNNFRRQISLIMGQKAQLWWDLPAADCFLLLQEIYRISAADYRQRLDFLATTLGVTKLLNIQVRRLSLGERMKMELIAALLHQPKVVFLDEPTLGLDLTAQRAIRKFLLDYRRSHRPAMLLTSHYMEDIAQLCERIVIIKEGRLIYDGLLREVTGRYAAHKNIAVRLNAPPDFQPQRNDDLSLHVAGLTAGIATVHEYADNRLTVRAGRDAVTAVAAQLLQKLPVADLTIEEEDIGTVIESIMREGMH